MKKKLQLLGIMLFLAFSVNAQIAFNWEKSNATATLPTWFSTGSLERGLAYSPNNNRLLVASRNGGNLIYVIDAATGENVMVAKTLKTLNVTDVTGGTLNMNDIEADDESALFLCNLSTNVATSAFKIYMWANEDAAPVNIINYTNTELTNHRFGDKFTVTGKVSDNTARIHAISGSGAVIEWTTQDQGANWTPQVLFTVAVSVGSSPDVCPIPGTTNFVCNGNGTAPIIVDNMGATLKALPTDPFKTGTNALSVIVKDNKTYIITFYYVGGAVAEIYDITDLENATILDKTTSLGATSNANGTGDVDIKTNEDGSYDLFVLGTNNGFGVAKILSGQSTAINNFENAKIKMYPNPANNFIIVEGNDIRSISIASITGQEILTAKNLNNKTELNIQGLTKGIYFLKVNQTNGKSVTEKFVKQ